MNDYMGHVHVVFFCFSGVYNGDLMNDCWLLSVYIFFFEEW